MATYTAAQLEAVGGKRWQKAGKDRVYFNDLAALYGLSCSYYHSGNISGATLDGETISNTTARKIAGDLAYGKFWFDLTDGKFYSQGFTRGEPAKLVAGIKAKLAALPAGAAAPSPRYVCDECGAELSRPYCPSCRDEMMIREVA